MQVSFYLILAALLPLAGFLLLVFLGRRLGGLAGTVATLLTLAALGLSITALAKWVGKDSFNEPHYVEAMSYRWLGFPAAVERGAAGHGGPVLDSVGQGSQGISVGYFIDSLTVAMFVMVTLIASLVHLFSIVYMAGDQRLPRYFAYLGLFLFGMLGVILSNSLVQVLIFWQIAGLASYLLIGFWFDRRGAAMGAMKSLIVGAVGDAAFVVGIGILLAHVGTAGLNFADSADVSMGDVVRRVEMPAEILQTPPGTSPESYWATGVKSDAQAAKEYVKILSPTSGGFLGLYWLTWAGMLLFAGAAAKSAQFPLHVWLADAMEAPAPSSALVHGAAFVGSGVYVVARIYPILTFDAHLAIAIIGCVTLLLGALLALVQTDLKRVLAYSVISQVGYMMLFMGTGGYTAGLVHLFTHAFFSACLFLAAGSVIHAVKGQQDMRQMGGLWRKLPLTALAFGIGGLALIGVPFFSGAYSRGLGLAGVYEYAHALASPKHARAAMVLFYVPAMTCFVTAFYAARCWWLVFGGKSRNEDLAEEAHEPFLMVLPIGILALLSVNFYEFFLLPSLVGRSLSGGPPVIRTTSEHARAILAMRQGGYALWGFLGAVPAILIYYRGLGLAERLRRLPVLNVVYLWLREGMFLEVVYRGVLLKAVLMVSAIAGFVEKFVVDVLVNFVGLMWRGVSRLSGDLDRDVVDGAARGLGAVTQMGAAVAAFPRAGRVRVYVLVMIFTVVVLGLVVGGAVWLRRG